MNELYELTGAVPPSDVAALMNAKALSVPQVIAFLKLSKREAVTVRANCAKCAKCGQQFARAEWNERFCGTCQDRYEIF